ncbi:hypothetical protein T01_13433, partial [Trichinella spiralis]
LFTFSVNLPVLCPLLLCISMIDNITRYIRIHLEQPPPNIHNGQGHCVMRSVYMFGKATIKFSPQTEWINFRPSVDGSQVQLEN